jgi:hypothetical protein
MTVCTVAEGNVGISAGRLLARGAEGRMPMRPYADSSSVGSVLPEVATAGTWQMQELIEEPEVFGGALSF